MTLSKGTFKQLVYALLLLLTPIASHAFHVVGYMPTWTGNVNTIRYDKFTHLNYAFILPTSTGGLTSLSNPSRLHTLVSLAHAQNVKVCIAVGGWNSGNDSAFETFAADSTYRANFTNNILAFITTYNLDGMDMDWEFPDPGASATNYAKLMKQLSDTLHHYNKILTAAVITRGTTGGGVLSEVFDYVDFLNLMAYDAGNPHSSYGEANSSIDYWQGRGLPAEKTVLGVPFYGRSPERSYKSLVAEDPQAPYKDNVGFVNYNGIQTMKNKTQLAKNKCAGIMIWDITMDTDDHTSLLTAIHSKLGTATGIKDRLEAETIIFPNPSDREVFIMLPEDIQAEPLEISIQDASGKEVMQWVNPNPRIEEKVNVEILPEGIYFLQLKSEGHILQKKLVIN